ncbi:MAG TPA: hypothetical protein VMU61_01910 [Candidatus Aquilonibacter sp.]|nr:hypothetical protein [Candidatus Aquilonibacter sp.]
MPEKRKFRVGDWVEVRSKQEILCTLDHNAQLDGMPFMPEMFAFCGKRFQVYKRAHKTCDTVFPVRGRRVADSVHLDTRCDGSAHGGCQAGCLIFWKEAWLKPLGNEGEKAILAGAETTSGNSKATTSEPACTEAEVMASTQIPNPDHGPTAYVCQATRLPYATSNLEWWEPDQYIEDYTSGNVSLWRIFCGAVYFVYFWLTRAGIGLGRPLRWFYDRFCWLWGGFAFPRRDGVIPLGQSTPVQALDIQPGELVRIKPYREILKTLNQENRNRGLYFDAEEVPYCGGTYRVLRRVERIINERTGHMREMRTPCLILDSVICQSRYSECRLFCPRSIYAYWREIWLERVSPVNSQRERSQEERLATESK